MKKNIGTLGAILLICSGLNAAIGVDETNSVTNLNADEFFCDAGWKALDGYWDNGGDDGFYAGALFEAICG